MQSRTNYKEYGAIKIYNNEVGDWTFLRPIKIGDIKQSVSQVDHNGWLICDGRTLNKADYLLLWNLIGYSFGGSGATFDLPDLRGRVPGMIGQGDGLTNRTMGSYVGAETHTLTIPEMPSHTHGITDPGHTHGYYNNSNNQSLEVGGSDLADNQEILQITSSAQTGITINAAGGGLAHNNIQPTLFMANTFIYARST